MGKVSMPTSFGFLNGEEEVPGKEEENMLILSLELETVPLTTPCFPFPE